MLHKISMVFILVFSIGCMKLKKKGEEDRSAQTPQVQSTRAQSDNLDYFYDFSEKNQKIIFQIPSVWPQQFVVEKSRRAEKIYQREISNLNGTWQDDFYDDAKINYKFYEKSGEKMVLLDEIEVLPMFNLNLQSDLDLYRKYEINDKVKRLFFRQLNLGNRSKIFIGNFKGQIEIENLSSDHGSIQTFPESARALIQDGKSAGGFDLHIQNGQGELHINLIAESGAHGLPGNPPDEKLKGAIGQEGKSAKFTLRSSNGCFPGELCLAGLIYDCSSDPGMGGDGKTGSRGYPGQDAGRGGSVEKVNVDYLSTSLNIQINRVAGRGGRGGKGGGGGAGGLGGPGGDGGTRDLFRFFNLNPDDKTNASQLGLKSLGTACKPAARGESGLRGDNGLDGNDGLDGVIY